jgi:hypothetical protein
MEDKLRLFSRPAFDVHTLINPDCVVCEAYPASTEYAASYSVQPVKGCRWIPVCYSCKKWLGEGFKRRIYNGTVAEFEASVRKALNIDDGSSEYVEKRGYK